MDTSLEFAFINELIDFAQRHGIRKPHSTDFTDDSGMRSRLDTDDTHQVNQILTPESEKENEL